MAGADLRRALRRDQPDQGTRRGQGEGRQRRVPAALRPQFLRRRMGQSVRRQGRGARHPRSGLGDAGLLHARVRRRQGPAREHGRMSRSRPMATMRIIGLGLAALVLLAGPALAEPRVALVIGNANYGGDLGQLPNPANDARLMAKTLRGIGFTVVEAEDADQTQMKRAIQDFSGQLATAGGGATGLFFYAGHGLQVAGTNYLIPVHAKIAREGDVDIEAVPVDLVMKQMAFADSAVNIVILDACRNNPLARGFRSATRGLADPSVRPMGSFIAYSTAPGDVAEDGNGANSPYTTALAEAITQPGASINDVFQNVRGKVLAATDRKQVPWDASSLTAPFYFVPATATKP